MVRWPVFVRLGPGGWSSWLEPLFASPAIEDGNFAEEFVSLRLMPREFISRLVAVWSGSGPGGGSGKVEEGFLWRRADAGTWRDVEDAAMFEQSEEELLNLACCETSLGAEV